MKKFTSLLSWVVPAIIIMQACSKSSSGGGNNPPPPPPPPPPGSSITLTLSKTQIYADGWEETKITVKDQNNNDVTSGSSIYLDNSLYFATNYFTNTPGTYKFKAVKGTLTSPEVTLTVLDPGPSPFSQKIIVEDYTGTWCQYCPRVSMALETYASAYPDCIVIANHGGTGGGLPGTLYGPDPYQFIYHDAMKSNVYGSSPAVAITGYPNAFVDRSFKWNENPSTITPQFTNRRPPLGLAFQTTVGVNSVDVTSKVKFDVNTDVDLKLVVYLVEDGIVHAQVNAPSNNNGLPNPITNYIHNGVLRATGTDVYGDLIPKASQVKGTIYTKTFSFNTSGYILNNCRIISFVVAGPNNLNKVGVQNVQTVEAGENQDFD